jgi:hypothetical protein
VDPGCVLWIGGATGSGKTSISRALAFRHDLQLYNVDHRTYDHVLRLPPGPKPDWSRPLAGMVELVDELLAPAIGTLPRKIDRSVVRRFENDVLARQVRLYKGSGDAPGDLSSDDWTLDFACECDRPGCVDVLELSLAAYERLSATRDRSPLRAPR